MMRLRANLAFFSAHEVDLARKSCLRENGLVDGLQLCQDRRHLRQLSELVDLLLGRVVVTMSTPFEVV
jgi:hypothetical protein